MVDGSGRAERFDADDEDWPCDEVIDFGTLKIMPTFCTRFPSIFSGTWTMILKIKRR